MNFVDVHGFSSIFDPFINARGETALLRVRRRNAGKNLHTYKKEV